ncbi:hypothetical protein [Kitasatospora sp. NPDC051914]|uniref:hypothetical protein n=1 Tax=Kitasatospora sp. NPDC051914 TaxID=3154945 RepID=UPI0034479653
MSVTLPLLLVLAIAAYLTVRHLHLRWWAVLPLVLLGFYLAGSSFGPLIDSTTKTGVDVVNTTTK